MLGNTGWATRHFARCVACTWGRASRVERGAGTATSENKRGAARQGKIGLRLCAAWGRAACREGAAGMTQAFLGLTDSAPPFQWHLTPWCVDTVRTLRGHWVDIPWTSPGLRINMVWTLRVNRMYIA